MKESKEEAQETETKPESLPVGMGSQALNPALFSLANSFALDRFAGENFLKCYQLDFIYNIRSIYDESWIIQFRSFPRQIFETQDEVPLQVNGQTRGTNEALHLQSLREKIHRSLKLHQAPVYPHRIEAL